MTKVDYTFERRMELNYKEGREDGLREGKVETILELMKNMKWSAKQAMKSVGIPEDDFDTYMDLLQEDNVISGN